MPALVRAASLSCVIACVSAVAAQEPSEVLRQVRSAALDPDRAVGLDAVEIDMGLGRLVVEHGWLVPARAIAGQTAEMTFVGRGRFRIEPPDAIEADQLELFTGERALDVGVTRAVLVIGDPSVAAALLGRASVGPIDADALRSATELFTGWVGGAERAGIGADAAVFRSTLGDPTHRRYFTAVFESDELDRFFYLFDPEELEQITLGQFVPYELDDVERYRVERAIRRAKKSGRSIQTRLEALGDWNTWLQSSARGASGNVQPGSASFEPSHYEIDATILPADQRIEAKASIELVAQAGGSRTVTLSLFPDLRPSALHDGTGRPLTWFRSGSDLHVLLGGAVAKGGTVRVDVAYSGTVLEELEKGILRLSDTYSWYPHAGSDDRATYEVTLRRPKRFELLASGRVVERREEAGQAIERRVLEVPARAFSFEIGAFDVVEEQVGHVALSVGFSKSTLALDTGAKQDVLDTLRNALAFYEATFGPYPTDQLSVVTIPREFSQGFLGFLTLSHHLLAVSPGWYVVGSDHRGTRQRERIETVAHELAHQWWGNKVGWSGYRDQWLSEALAEYSAVLYAARQSERQSVYLMRHARGWQDALRDTTRDGHTVESLGPVVLGQRLSSSLSTSAYDAVVYRKGSVVFRMLAAILKEEKMTEMLRELATRVDHRPIDTATFIGALERMSGFDLTTFARQFIYGTGVPEVYYSYRFGKDGAEAWNVEGEARMVAPADYRYALRRDAGWDVTRKRVPTLDVSNWALLVPFQVVLAGVAEEASGGGRNVARGLGGSLVIRGARTPFAFPIRQQPADFWLDQRGQALAYFYCENRDPKRMLLYRAMELEGDEAATLLEQALETPLLSEKARAESELSPKEIARQEGLLDAAVHLELARLHLDHRETEAARTTLDAVERLIGGIDENYRHATRSFLAARVALQQGDYEAAYREGRELWLSFARQDSDTVGTDLLRNRWRDGRVGDGEDYAMLAVAAYETGRLPVARRAADEAEKRGADMRALRDLLGGS